MATRNEVLTLFGATPQQIMEKQRREQAAMVLQQQDPFARAGSAIGVGLARLFGGDSAEVEEARRVQSAREGINLNTTEGMREAATRLQNLGLTDQALQLFDLADRRDTADIARNLEGKVTVNKEVIVPVETVNEFNEPVVRNIKIDVPYEYDRKTGETKSIFGADYEQELAQRRLAEQGGGVAVEITPETSEDRLRSTFRDQVNRIPVGGVENIGGRYIRRFGNGPNDIEELTLEQVRQLPTELGNVGGP